MSGAAAKAQLLRFLLEPAVSPARAIGSAHEVIPRPIRNDSVGTYSLTVTFADDGLASFTLFD